MKNTSVAAPGPVVKIPKAEAIEKLSKHSAGIRSQLAAAQLKLKAAVSPDKYALNFQANALKKELNFCKAQINRLKKEPRTEVIWDEKFGA
jgi:cell division protein FtsB